MKDMDEKYTIGGRMPKPSSDENKMEESPYLTDSLTGILKNDADLKKEKEKILKKKYRLDDSETQYKLEVVEAMEEAKRISKDNSAKKYRKFSDMLKDID